MFTASYCVLFVQCRSERAGFSKPCKIKCGELVRSRLYGQVAATAQCGLDDPRPPSLARRRWHRVRICEYFACYLFGLNVLCYKKVMPQLEAMFVTGVIIF